MSGVAGAGSSGMSRVGYACRHGLDENSIFKMKAAYRRNQSQVRFSCLLVIDCLSLQLLVFFKNNYTKEQG